MWCNLEHMVIIYIMP